MKNKKYLITDIIETYQWKFVKGAQKTIMGYDCNKATTIDEKGNKINVWYSKELPAGFGPTKYDGLPGMILQMNYELYNMSITAISISFRKVSIVEPTHGNVITMEEYLKKNGGVKPTF